MNFKLALQLAALVTCLHDVHSVLPGFQIRLSKKGLDYANTVAHTALGKELKTLKIPDQSGSEHHFEWSLTGIQNRGCEIPSSSMAFTPGQNGLTWAMQNLGVKVHSDWRVKYKKGWFKVSTSGSVDADVSQVSAQITVHLAVQSDGRPSVSLAKCTSSVGSVHVEFHRGTAFILNLFRGTVEKKIKDLMQDEICKLVAKEINVDANAQLKKIKVNVEMDHRFLLNYSLVSSPKVAADNIETQHKGEVFWKADVKEAPFSPKAIPALADESRMMYLWITDYVANSFAYTAELHKFLQYNLTNKDFPSANSSYLNTTCKLYCIGKIIPQIGKMFPNAQIEARIISLQAPSLIIDPKGMTVSAVGNTELYAHTPDKKAHFVMTLNVKVSVSVKGSVVNERLCGEITDKEVTVSVVRSAIPNVHASLINLLLNGALDLAIIPKLNAIMKEGVELPVTGAVSFQNTQLTLLKGAALVATDLKYVQSSPLTFVSEHQRAKLATLARRRQ